VIRAVEIRRGAYAAVVVGVPAISLGIPAQGVNVAVRVILAICVAASSHRRGSEVNWWIPTNETGRGQPRRNQTEEYLP
jgi:hypothetical protein